MEVTVPFNGRQQLHCILRMVWLSRDDASISAATRAVYTRQQVPLLQLDKEELVRLASDAVRELAQYVDFECEHPKPYLTDGLLYGLLLHARSLGIYRHFLSKPPRPDLAKLYMIQGRSDEYDEKRRKYSDKIRAAIKQWKDFKDMRDAVKGFGKLLQSKTLREQGWHIEVRNWTAYARHCIEESPRSRLHGRVRAPDEQFRFVVLEPDSTQYGDWEQLVASYMHANPLPREDTHYTERTSMDRPPYPERILSRGVVTLVALDMRQAQPVMAGYAICTVRAVKPRVAAKYSFDAVNPLQSFVQRMRMEVKHTERRASDCGFDLFSVDALHVSLAYRGTPNLPHVLLLHCMELARQSHRLLGFTLLVSQSAAAATRSLLTQMGFTHHNRAQSLRWLIMAFKDYHSSLGTERLYEPYHTPVKLLDTARLSQALREWLAQYRVHAQPLVDVSTRLAQYTTHDGVELATALPGLITTLEAQCEALDDSARDEEVMAALDSLDPDDTFMYLDKTRDDAALFAATDDLAARYVRGDARVGKGRAPPTDGRPAEPRRATLRTHVVEPLEDAALVLYELWALVDVPFEQCPNPGSTPAPFTRSPEEEARERASRALERAYLDGLLLK